MLNKKQANMWVKIVALAVAAAFIAIGALSLVNPGGPALNTATQASSEDQQTQQLITQLQGQLAANPTSTALLLQLGNTYYDLGRQQVEAKKQVLAQTNFELAVDSYKKVLKQRPKDADVRTDMATAMYYAGQTQQAVAQVARVLKEKPNHENALINGGIFYADAGKKDDARRLWNRYLSLYPQGQGAAQVRQMLSQLK